MKLTLNIDSIIKQGQYILTVFGAHLNKTIELEEMETEISSFIIRQEPVVIYTIGNVSWRGSKERVITLSSNDWELLQTPQKVTISWLEEKMSTYLPGCKTERGLIEGYEVLLIEWPGGISIEVGSGEESKKNERKSMSKQKYILTVLSKQPDWIGAQITSSSKAFSHTIPLGFSKRGIVIFEGKDATYGIKDGLKYSQIKSKSEILGNDDCLTPIKHNKGFKEWEKSLNKILENS